MLDDFSWNYFSKTGSVEAYLLYREVKDFFDRNGGEPKPIQEEFAVELSADIKDHISDVFLEEDSKELEVKK